LGNLICRHDSLFWVNAYFIGSESGALDVLGLPVASDARRSWYEAKLAKQEQEHDSIRESYGLDKD